MLGHRPGGAASHPNPCPVAEAVESTEVFWESAPAQPTAASARDHRIPGATRRVVHPSMLLTKFTYYVHNNIVCCIVSALSMHFEILEHNDSGTVSWPSWNSDRVRGSRDGRLGTWYSFGF